MDNIVSSFSSLIGAKDEEGISSVRITCYIADVDRNRENIEDIDRYVNLTAKAMYMPGRGATIVPTVGHYTETGKPENAIVENTYVLFCYVREEVGIERLMYALRGVLHKYGREANQKEVAVGCSGEDGRGKYSNRTYFIDNYDPVAQ